MAILKDHAHVLRIYEYGNTSLVLSFFGRALGSFRVLAKGSRRWQKKGFEGGFDLLAQGEVLVYPRRNDGLWILKEWDERARPNGLGDSFEKLQAASYLCELTEALTRETSGSGWHEQARGEQPEDQTHAQLSDALRLATDQLEAGTPPGAVLLAYTVRALELAGLAPSLEHCDRCARDMQAERAWARLSHDGLQCETCLAEQALEMLPVNAPPPPTRRELARLLDADPELGRGTRLWLSPEALGAVHFIRRTGKQVKLSRRAAMTAAKTLVALVHLGLERDLRTLRAAARAVVAMGPARSA